MVLSFRGGGVKPSDEESTKIKVDSSSLRPLNDKTNIDSPINSNLQNRSLPFGIRLFNRGAAEKIISACIIKISKTAKNIRWNISFADFIIGITNLRAIQKICNILLAEILILSQISDSFIYHLTTTFFIGKYMVKQNVILTFKTKCFKVEKD